MFFSIHYYSTGGAVNGAIAPSTRSIRSRERKVLDRAVRTNSATRAMTGAMNNTRGLFDRGSVSRVAKEALKPTGRQTGRTYSVGSVNVDGQATLLCIALYTKIDDADVSQVRGTNYTGRKGTANAPVRRTYVRYCKWNE